MFGFFKKREHPERRAIREQFEGIVSCLRSADLTDRVFVGQAINLANSAFIQKFASVAAFKALPSDDTGAYIEALIGMEKKLSEEGDRHSSLGFTLFRNWVAMVALGDEPLARQFAEALAEVSRLGDTFLGPISPSPNQEPRPAGYDQMTEEQRTLSAKFVREQKEREMRAGPAVAGSFEDGLAAFKKGDYAMALQLWGPLADQGHAEAQYHIGFSYLRGHGVPRDLMRGMAWLRKAAEQGDVSAQYLLGAIYYHGNQGVQKDAVAAAAWFRKAAEQCYAPAQRLLGIMCSTSLEELVQAYMWLTLAASRYGAPEKENRDRVLGFRQMLAVRMTPAQIAEAEKLAREWKPSR